MATKRRPRSPGRPGGSVMLTPEIERTIASYIEAGAWDYVAAEAAGIDARTFRDWMARGEGRHPTRAATPKLTAFARTIREARARARAAREIEVAAKEPKFWLAHAGRSKAGREGWSEPVPDEAEAAEAKAYVPTPEEAAETLRILVETGALKLGCLDPSCGCAAHARVHRG